MTRRAQLLAAVAALVFIVGAAAIVAVAALDRRSDLASRQEAARAELATFALPFTVADDVAGRNPGDPNPDDPNPGDPSPGGVAAVPDAGPDDGRWGGARGGWMLAIDRVPGDDYGRIIRLGTDGTREPVGEERCERIHAGAGTLVCLTRDRAPIPAWRAQVVPLGDPDARPLLEHGTGLPSRARISPDGSWVAWTGFVTGHSYLQVGEFATETRMARLDGSGLVLRPEQMTVVDRPARFDAIDGNWWGVTFDPMVDGRAYATYGTREGVEIVQLDLTTQQVVPLGFAGTCPSISPDGQLLVFKRRVNGPDELPLLMARHLRTGREWVLGESRFVDDQVEWLDSTTVVYALGRDDSVVDQPAFDLWSLSVDEGASPEMIVPFANSPMVLSR